MLISKRCVWAEIEVGGEHLRLFSEHNAQGIQASVYNVKTGTWIAPSESVDDIEKGKDRAADHAKAYLAACCQSAVAFLAMERGACPVVIKIRPAEIVYLSAPKSLVPLTLIHRAVWLHQRKGRDLDIKLLVSPIDHLVGAVH